MARPKKLTKAKVKPIVDKIETVISEYVTLDSDVESIVSSIRSSLDEYVRTQNNDNRNDIPEEIAKLSGVVDSRNLARTGASVNSEGFHVRTKGSSEKADGVKGL
jgi:hypothetical protein